MSDGKNKPILIVGMIFLVFVLIISGVDRVSKDKRENKTAISESKYLFTNSVIELDGSYLWDKKKEIAELNFKKEDAFIVSDDFSISLTDQDEQKIDTEIIKGDTKEVEEDIYQTNYTVRFTMPRKTYYIKAKISKNDVNYEFSIDYRDFKKANLK